MSEVIARQKAWQRGFTIFGDCLNESSNHEQTARLSGQKRSPHQRPTCRNSKVEIRIAFACVAEIPPAPGLSHPIERRDAS
jgi:hypothetical protein